MSIYERKLNWSLVGGELAFLGSFLSIIGSILALANHADYKLEPTFWLNKWTLFLSLFIMVLEFPRFDDHRNLSRWKTVFGDFSTSLEITIKKNLHDKFLLIRKPYARSMFYLIVSISAFFNDCTLLAFICFVSTAGIYCIAGIFDQRFKYKKVAKVNFKRKKFYASVRSQGRKLKNTVYFDEKDVFHNPVFVIDIE